jgi:hypothetical protein
LTEYNSEILAIAVISVRNRIIDTAKNKIDKSAGIKPYATDRVMSYMEILSSMTRSIIFDVTHINVNDIKGSIAPEIMLMDDII